MKYLVIGLIFLNLVFFKVESFNSSFNFNFYFFKLINKFQSFAGLGGTDNIEETEKFLIQKIKTLPKNVLQVLERLRIMRKQVERNEPALLEFFENIKEKEENESKETEERTESGGGRDEESESGGGQDETINTLKMSNKKPFQRLPKDVRPINYNLSFKPDLLKFTFEGLAVIDVETKVRTKKIILNCVEIEIKDLKFESNSQKFENVNIEYNKENETATFTFPEELKEGPGTLFMNFMGKLNDKLKGFYRSKYFDLEGKEKYAAVTQFEPTDARQAFPCWDEPSIKATFVISLTVPSDRVALSNMPEEKEEIGDSKNEKIITFQKTPVMSTYLVAMVVGEYDFVEAKDSDGVKVRVYTPLGKKAQGQFALDVAVKTLPFYNKYFNVAYPLPKMDLIAIADFAAGAMENWGLVTYRETALLIDEAHSSTASRQRVALVVGHEIAHQWFGNLVTMEWWTHLWLNEGFASWIEYLCVDHCFPEFDIWTQFASSDFGEAVSLDALKNSHPIEVEVGHPSEIDEIFDSISYSKGASVIRMLHDYIGDEDFRKGMHNYLTRHQYKNTFTEDLWKSLEEASGKPINSIMCTWTKQMGFPVIKVTEEIKEKSRILKLKQVRFIADGSLSLDQKWMVPISISSTSSPDKAIKKYVLDKQEDTITLENIAPDAWIKLNVGGVGFYRVDYDDNMLKRLLPSIKSMVLSPRDRLSLQSDLFALSRAGHAKTVEVLKVAESFQNETNYTVWTDLNSHLSQLNGLYQYSDFSEKFNKFLVKLFQPLLIHVGWDPKESEGPLVTMLRTLVIGRLGKSGDKEVITESSKRFKSHVEKIKIMPGDLRKAVYSIVMKYGTKDDYETLLNMYKSADLQEEKVRILSCLGSVTTKELINRTLKFSISPDVRNQDSLFGIMGVGGSALGREMAWNFIKENWKELYDRYQGGFILARLLKSSTEDFASKEFANDIEDFFKKNPAPSAQRNIKQSLENIRLNIDQLARDKEEVGKFLQSY